MAIKAKGGISLPKTIFGTTEKSNFILNMKTEKYWDFNLKILLGFMILMPVLSIPLEFARTYSLPLIALAIAGVAAIVFTFIGFMKSVTPKKLWVLTGILAAMVVWGYVSLMNSFCAGDAYNYNVATFGFDGRGEGLLSILFYGCFFMLGAQLGTDSNRRKLLNGMLLMGLAECIWGLLQALPIGFKSYYQNLEPMLLFRTFLPSGLTGSPIFLATLLVMLEFPAMLMAAFTENKKQRILCLVCTACFALTAVKTQCLLGLAGTGLAIVLGGIYLLWKKAGKRGIAVILTAVIAFGAGLGWSFAASAVNGTYEGTNAENKVQGQLLYDCAIMWEDSSYRLEASGYYVPGYDGNPNGAADAESITGTYSYLWSSTAKIIRDYPLVGTGPDSLVYPQMYQSIVITSNPNTFDRAYNFYLHTAATLGIPMLLMVIAILLFAFVRGGKSGAYGGWVQAAILGAVLLYVLAMVIGASAVTVAPLFWMLAGCCCNMDSDEAK